MMLSPATLGVELKLAALGLWRRVMPYLARKFSSRGTGLL